MADDPNLHQKIQSVLESDPTLSVYGVKATVSQGLVTLQGVVDVLKDKTYAEERIRAIPGVRAVENALVICTDGGIDDEDVRFEVAEELMADPAVPESIGVEVHSGHVRLVGTADTRAEAEAAVKDAQKARGVVEVANEIQLNEDLFVDDATLANRVRDALTRLRLGQGIEIRTEAGIVYLTGKFQEPGDYSTVEEALLHIPGVKAVRNRTDAKLDIKDLAVVGLLDRIGKDPFLNEAEISYFWEDKQFTIEGVVDSVETKKALEQAIQDLIDDLPERIMIENRVRVEGD